MVTEEDIQNVVAETSENLTTMADWTLEKIGNSVEEAITKAQKDLDEARAQLQEKWNAYLDALAETAAGAVDKERDTINTTSGYKGYSGPKD
jgi:Skp family chaperone for outer membrane proteins